VSPLLNRKRALISSWLRHS